MQHSTTLSNYIVIVAIVVLMMCTFDQMIY